MMDSLICMTFNKGFDYNSYCRLDPLTPAVPFLYPLEISENFRKNCISFEKPWNIFYLQILIRQK